MTKTIQTLVKDIYALFTEPHEFDEGNVDKFAHRLATHIKNRVSDEKGKPSLRMSNLGTPCDRKLWYSINMADKQEPLPPATRFKFLYGDILEELVLFLATEAGHSVEGAQDQMQINGVKGHRDAVIDGVVVDVKSASTYSYRKFADHLTKDQDAFGYLDQLGAYLYASKDDPLVKDKNKAAFIAVDKTLGNIVVDVQPNTGKNYDKLVDEKRAIVEAKEPPPRGYTDEEDGKSGNRKLGVACSYCPFKRECWPGLRSYSYSTGPRFLTVVKNEPKVMEASWA